MSGGPECKFKIIARREKASKRRSKERKSMHSGAFSDSHSYGTKLQGSKIWSKGPPR